jgi:Dolichyl-phosphate-mannose-protein mannosyltransferase
MRIGRAPDAEYHAEGDTRYPYGAGVRGRIELQLRRLFSRCTVSAWAAVAPAALTLVLGGAFLGRASMWTDEAATWFSSSQPVAHFVRNSTYVDVVFLPYYLFMHFWLGVSQALWWMRVPSLLAGATTVAALVLLARRWLPLGWSVLAGLLLALNPLFAEWTIQARPYAAATLFAVLSMAALASAIDRGGTLRWVRYGLASLGMLLLHLMAVFVLAAQIVGVAIARRRSAWAGMASTLGCVAVAVSPLAVIAASETRQISWIPPVTPRTFLHALADVSGGRAGALALVICGIIVAATIASTPPGGERALGFALCLAWGTVPVLLLVLVSFLRPLYVARYAVVSLPGVALIEAMGGWRAWTILTAPDRTRGTSGPRTQTPTAAGSARHHDRRRWAFIRATIAGGAACVAGLALLAHTSQVLRERYVYDDYRSAAAVLSSDLLERPAPVAVIPNWSGVGFSYYATPSALAHALSGQAIRAYNRHLLDWQKVTFGSGTGEPLQRSSVVSWPIGVKPYAPTARCAVGWVIGRGVAPSKTFIIDGSSCRLSRVHYYGLTWVASAGG